MTDVNIDGIITWLSNWFQDKLISGTNIKTINNQSLLGSGNISISGGGGGNVDTDLDPTSTNPVQNQAIANKFETIVESDNVTDLYGTLFRLDDLYGTNDLAMLGDKLVYSYDEDKLFYDKNGDANYDEIVIAEDLRSKADTNHTHTKSQITDFPTVESQSITVTSATSGSNYFSGGTREITARKWGNIVNVTINFYGVGAKQASTSTDTIIGTLPSGWIPSMVQYFKPSFTINSNQNYSSFSIDTNGNIKLRIGSTTSLSNVTFRGSITFLI